MTINRRNLNLAQHYWNAPKQEEIQKSEEVVDLNSTAAEEETAAEQVVEKAEPTDLEKAFDVLSNGKNSIVKSEEEEEKEESEEEEVEKSNGENDFEEEVEDELGKSEDANTFNDIMKSFESGELKDHEGNTVDSKEEALQLAVQKGESEVGFLGMTATGKPVYEDIEKSEDFSRQDHLDAWMIFKSKVKGAQTSREVSSILEKSNYHQNQADRKLSSK